MPTPTPLARHLRVARGHLTQSELVATLRKHGADIHTETVSRYENGRHIPPAPVLHAYSKAFDLDAAELLALASASAQS